MIEWVAHATRNHKIFIIPFATCFLSIFFYWQSNIRTKSGVICIGNAKLKLIQTMYPEDLHERNEYKNYIL